MTNHAQTSNGTLTTGTILDRILARTALDVALRQTRTPIQELERRVVDLPARASLTAAVLKPGLSVIAEVKRASPSRGRFPVEIDACSLAREYIVSGADAISVLTDEPFFQGSLADLESVVTEAQQSGSPIPVLRKDFILAEYQILESWAHGATAILLIVAALDQALLKRLLATASDFQLDALVEVHNEDEMHRAADAGAMLIGINTRNLHTFEVDLAVAERLAPAAPRGAALVGESGIFTAEDAARMLGAGLDAILVGESLVMAPDRAAALAELKFGAGNVSVDSRS